MFAPSPALRGLRLLAASALLGAVVLVGAAPAAAHAVLESTNPAPGTLVEESPDEVVLRFTEPVDTELGGVRIFDESGDRVELGETAYVDGDRSVVATDVPELGDGGYIVTWRVVSEDSHPVRGAFTFRVGDEAATAAELETLSSDLLRAEGGSTPVGVTFAVDRWAVFLATALFAGAAFFLAIAWPAGRDRPRVRRIVRAAWLVAFVASAASIGLQGVYAQALPLSDALDPSVWADIADTRYGQAALVRLAVLAVAVPLVAAILRDRDPDARQTRGQGVAVGVVGLALGTSIALAGHATTGILVPWAVATDVVHVAGVSVWAGGLAIVLLVVLARRSGLEMAPPVTRFSALAPWALGAIVLSGAFQTWRQVGSIDALRETDYGTVLLVKLGLVAVLVVVAAVARTTLRDRVDLAHERFAPGRQPLPAGPGARRAGAVEPLEASADPAQLDEDDHYLASRLRRLVAVEAVLAVAIFAVTAVLVNAQPARSEDEEPYTEIVAGEGASFDVIVTPAAAGLNDFHATALTPGGTQRDVLEMTMEISLPSEDIGPFVATSSRDRTEGEYQLRRLAPGHYAAFGVDVPISGDWEMSVSVVVDRVETASATTTVPIR